MGEDIGGATVNHGELAIAFWTGSNGIALSGPPEQFAARLEQAAAVVRAAVPLVVPEQVRHLPEGLDPWEWITLGTDADRPDEHANTRCRAPGITVRDPRRVTCGDCIHDRNARWGEPFGFPALLPISADTTDRTIGDQLPYASITWIDEAEMGENLPFDDAPGTATKPSGVGASSSSSILVAGNCAG